MTPLEYRMHTGTQPLFVTLRRREVLAVQVDAGLKVSCLEGRLWITQHGRTEDIVLETGGEVELSHKGNAVVQALRPVRLALQSRRPYSTSRRSSGNTFDTFASR